MGLLRSSLAASAATFVALAGVVAAAAAPSPGTEVVTEADVTRAAENAPPTDDWMLYTRAGTPPTAAAFVDGPAMPPRGKGSLRLTTMTVAEKVFLLNYEHVGTRLSDVDDISYSTFRSAGDAQQVAALNAVIDFNGPGVDGGFSTLVFEPVYNTDQAAITDDTWQSWDAFNGGQGIWWSTRDLTHQAAFTGYRSWSDIVADNPNAVVLGAFINQGSGNPGIDANVDAVTLGASGNSTTYDFEPNSAPVTKDDCKDGGWVAFHPAFSNQGDCVSQVVTSR